MISDSVWPSSSKALTHFVKYDSILSMSILCDRSIEIGSWIKSKLLAIDCRTKGSPKGLRFYFNRCGLNRPELIFQISDPAFKRGDPIQYKLELFHHDSWAAGSG